MADTTEFLEWLQIEMDRRNWKRSDLANAANINRQVIYGWFNQGKEPSPESLEIVAKVLKTDVETVFRIAKVLPPSKIKVDVGKQQILNEIEDMTKEERDELLSYIRWRKNRKNEH